MIARVEIGYGQSDKLVTLSADEATYVRLREIYGSAAPSPENREKNYHWPHELIIDMDTDGVALAALGIEFTVKNFKGTIPLTAILPEGYGETKVYVQVPHIGLLMIDEVSVEENCCTDRLQDKLDAGWRILCVCPPNAARRPDYILGRTKERS